MKCSFKERYWVIDNFGDPLGEIIKEGDWVFKAETDFPIKLAQITEIQEKLKSLNTRKEY
jgi:hypothetical protein